MQRRHQPRAHATFKSAVERSSFGTPEARKVRRYTSDATATRIVKRSRAVTRDRRSREG
jgi:hypothetical protein